MLKYLTDREKKIIEMRFWLLNWVNHTLEEVWAEFWVTRERIRQIEAKVLQKLKDHPTSIKIK
jgi:RNA polymerase primary sigma factor